LGITELPKISFAKLVHDSKKLVPSASTSIPWKKKSSGIRAQLVDKNTGSFEMDFVIKTQGRITHVLNYVSPGWTAAIPFARYIVHQSL
jgi:L-2-hydroxyglutarate oxidase LhgO